MGHLITVATCNLSTSPSSLTFGVDSELAGYEDIGGLQLSQTYTVRCKRHMLTYYRPVGAGYLSLPSDLRNLQLITGQISKETPLA